MRAVPRELHKIYRRLTPYERGALALSELLTLGRERELLALCRTVSSGGTVRWMKLAVAVASAAHAEALHCLARGGYSAEGSGRKWRRERAKEAAAWTEALRRLGRETGYPLPECRRALAPDMDAALPEGRGVPDFSEQYAALRRIWDAGGGSDSRATGRKLPEVTGSPEDPPFRELRAIEALALEETAAPAAGRLEILEGPEDGRLDMSRVTPAQAEALKRELDLTRPFVFDLRNVDKAELARFLIAENAAARGRETPRPFRPFFIFAEPEEVESADPWTMEMWLELAYPDALFSLQRDVEFHGRPWDNWPYSFDKETWRKSLETEKVEPWPVSDSERAEVERREEEDRRKYDSFPAERRRAEEERLRAEAEAEERRDVPGADMLAPEPEAKPKPSGVSDADVRRQLEMRRGPFGRGR